MRLKSFLIETLKKKLNSLVIFSSYVLYVCGAWNAPDLLLEWGFNYRWDTMAGEWTGCLGGDLEKKRRHGLGGKGSMDFQKQVKEDRIEMERKGKNLAGRWLPLALSNFLFIESISMNRWTNKISEGCTE